jgi:RTX calcium-binding nonapeptide repeat (4 copies)
VTVLNATSGNFTLTFNGKTTAGIPYNATAAVIQTALAGLSTVGSNNVAVTQTPAAGGTTYTITFQGTLAKANQPQITADASGLKNGANLLNPDPDGDGSPNIVFTSLQSLVAKLDSLGLPVSASYTVPLGGGPGEILFSLSSGSWLPTPATFATTTQGNAGTSTSEVDSITIDDSKNAGHTFRIGFKDANGVYNFTGDIADNAALGTVQSDLEAVSGIGAGNVLVGGSPDNYTITFQGTLANTDIADLEVVASADRLLSLPLNLNLNLGSLVNVSSTNSLDLFAALHAAFSFGIDLSPSTPIAIQANQFSPSTGVTVATQQDGSASQNEIQIITIHNANGGAFRLGFQADQNDPGQVTGDIAVGPPSFISNATLATNIKSALGAIVGGAGNLDVTPLTNPLTTASIDRVFQVTFKGGSVQHKNVLPLAVVDASIPANKLVGPSDNGRLLSDASFDVNLFNQPGVSVATQTQGNATNEVQLLTVNATGGTFALTFNGQTATGLAFNISAADMQTALVGLSSIGANNVAVQKSGNQYTITFQGGLSHSSEPLFTFDGSALTGPAATASVTTVTDGDATHNEVQVIALANTASGTFTLSFNGSAPSSAIAFNADAATVQAALQALSTIGPNNVTVQKSGSQYTITFVGAKADLNVPLLIADSSALKNIGVAEQSKGSSVDEVQVLTVLNANGGTFTLNYNGLSTDAVNYPLNWNASAADVQNALNHLVGGQPITVSVDSTVNAVAGGSEYTIHFTSPAHTNVAQLTADASTLTNSTNFAALTGANTVTVLASATTLNTSLDDLRKEVQAAINAKLLAAGVTPGFLQMEPITSETPFTTASNSFTTASSDIPLTLSLPAQVQVGSVQSVDATHQKQVIQVFGSVSNEMQLVTVNATGGTFELTFNSETTGPISQGASASAVESALVALHSIGQTGGLDNVSVSLSGQTYTVRFVHGLERNDKALTADGSALTGSGASVTVAQSGGTFTLAYGGNTTGQIAFGANATTVGNALAAAPVNMSGFSVTQNGTAYTITYAAGVNQISASGSGLAGETIIKTTVRQGDIGSTLSAALQSAVNTALAGTGVTVTITGSNGGPLSITPHNGNLAIDYGDPFNATDSAKVTAPVMAIVSGSGISLTAPAVTSQPDTAFPATSLNRRVEINTSFTNSAFQELGLLTSPTRFDGKVTNAIDIHLIVNGTDVEFTTAAGTYGSVSGLVAQLQTDLNAKLALNGFVAGDVKVEASGNIIKFAKNSTNITDLNINIVDGGVPETYVNGAVTDLGFTASEGKPQHSAADAFFVKDVSLTGSLDVIAPTITATASLGFLGITATGTGSIVGHAGFTIKDPTDGGSKVAVKDIVTALGKGQFLFDPTKANVTDGPTNGVVDPLTSLDAGLELTAAPTGIISGLGSLGSVTVTLDVPDWLRAPPMLVNDPLGFGHSSITFDGTTVTTLGTAAPSNGRLTSDVSFIVSAGGSEQFGILKASDTAGNNSATDLEAQFQAAVNAALAKLGGGHTITVGLANGTFTLLGDSGLSFRGDTIQLSFTKPDFVDEFQHLDFTSIIKGLQFVVNFLDNIPAAADVLNTKLPVINKSLGDLVNIAANLTDLLNQLTSNPASSVQTLETLLESKLGTPSLGHYVSFDGSDSANPALRFDIGLSKTIQEALPFNVDLSNVLLQIGLPQTLIDLIGNLVGLSGSGNLAVSATALFDLALGIGLKGADKGDVWLYTGATNSTGTGGSGLSLSASATGQNLNFTLQLGPFSAFVANGSGSLSAGLDVTLKDTGDHHFNIVTGLFSSPHFQAPGLSDLAVATNPGTADVNLPLFVGTQDQPISVGDPLHFTITNLLTGPTFDLVSHPSVPDFTKFFSLPTDAGGFLLSLLSNPADTIDGLDRVLGELQDAVNGQILGVKLPFIGDVLAGNPVAQFIGNFRDSLLEPLANTLREHNISLAGLMGLVQQTLFDVFNGDLHVLDKYGTESTAGVTADDVKISGFTQDSSKHFVQLDMDLGGTFTISTNIAFDLGIPALSISANLNPTITFAWHLHLGFGIDDHKGFYIVPGDDLHVGMTVDFGSAESGTPATATGQLAFLALKLTDEAYDFQFPDEDATHYSQLSLDGDVMIGDPNSDGKLTLSEMTSAKASDLIKPSISGNADLAMHAVVDFSTLGSSLTTVLPSVSTDIILHWHAEASPGKAPTFGEPYVDLADITLDLGSFISDFAGPVFNEIHNILSPFDWLIGPNGLMNFRIPLLSDLAGQTITMKDLVKAFDPEDGPVIDAFFDVLSEFYYLSDLVTKAEAEGGNIKIDFGDLLIADPYSGTDGKNPLTGSSQGSDLASMSNLSKLDLSNVPGASGDVPSLPQGTGSSTSSFVAGVSGSGSLTFPILKPENVFKLLLGQPATLVEYDMPTLGFSFFYRQQFPIFGPLFATIGGGLSAKLNLAFGYDTLGINEFIKSRNPADLIDGFFIDANDPKTGMPRPTATVDLQIAAGAEINLGIAEAGVEGGIEATINFNLDDLNNDGKIRLSELAANLEANDFNPLSVFDISGEIDFFLRAFLKIDLFLFSVDFEYVFAKITLFKFDITFNRPQILGALGDDGTLTLNIGPDAANRLKGDISDDSEHITVSGTGDDLTVSLGSSTSHFHGVKKLVADGGLGDDIIDLRNMTDPNVDQEIHGGDGNDIIYVGAGTANIFGDAGDDTIYGYNWDGSHGTNPAAGAETLDGGDGNNTITAGSAVTKEIGGAGVDTLTAGTANDIIMGGAGNDIITSGPAGSTTTVMALGAGSSPQLIPNGGKFILDFTGFDTDSVTFWLKDGKLLAGWGGTNGGSGGGIGITNDSARGIQIPDYDHKFTSSDITAFTKILGGNGADIFNVWQAGQDTTHALILDGGKGSDTYNIYGGDPTGTGPLLNVNIDDIDGEGTIANPLGNAWDDDRIVIDGTSGRDSIEATSSDVKFHLSGGNDQKVAFHAPVYGLSILRLIVFGELGDDLIRIDSTAQTVPVKVFGDGGTPSGSDGGDTIIIGNQLSNILEHSLPDPSINLGPLVLVGGGGYDTVVLDDTGDSTGRTGTMDSFMDPRPGGAVEVGKISDLGMAMAVDPPNTPDVGSVRFEGFESVQLKLGSGADYFSINNTITGMTQVSGGGGGDTIDVHGTNITSRDPSHHYDNGVDLSVINNVISAVTLGQNGTNQVQSFTLNPPAAASSIGAFTLVFDNGKDGPRETKPIMFGADAAAVANALLALNTIGFNSGNPNVDVQKVGNQYTVTFQNGLTNRTFSPMVVQFIPLLLLGGSGDDTVNLQSVTEDTFVLGEAGKDTINVNVETRAATLTPGAAQSTPQNPDVTFTASAAVFTSADVGRTLNINGGRVLIKSVAPDGLSVVGDYEDPTDSLLGVTPAVAGTWNLALPANPETPNATLTPSSALGTGVTFTASAAVFTSADVGRTLSINGGRVLITGFTDAMHLVGDYEVPATGTATAASGAWNLALLNGVNANLLIDGGDDNDTYNVNFIGGLTNSQINVFDSGTTTGDVLNMLGTSNNDTFLLRAAAAANGLAFVAMLNLAANVERVNYDTNLDSITLEGGLGDDQFFIDDTRAVINIYGDFRDYNNALGGNDFFQVGQLYQSQRDIVAGIANADQFNTLQTTKGWLSNGITQPMTIHGGAGVDNFVVFHNKAELSLDGDAGDDTFIIQAFALVGSQDTQRARTDVSGGAGSDLIQYAVNAPVDIDGGDGFDTVIVIGTEFNDDFVVTANGVFGAGLFVNFINIESLEIDGAEGDDRFFVQGTSPNFKTTIIGGLGSDTFNINGPTPANGVIANSLQGHSGLVSHLVTSIDSSYNGLKSVGISANVADNDEPAIVVTPSDPAMQVTEGSVVAATYTVVLTRDPGYFIDSSHPNTVNVSAVAPGGLVFANGDPKNLNLTFNSSNWWIPQTVSVLAAPDSAHQVEGARDAAIQHKVTVTNDLKQNNGDTIIGFASGGAQTANTLRALPGTFDFAGANLGPQGLLGAVVSIIGGTGVGQSFFIDKSTSDTLTIHGTWSVVPDGTSQFQILRYEQMAIPNVKVHINDADSAGLIVTQTNGSTDVREAGVAVQTVSATVQQITVDATGGTFTLSYGGQTTGAIAFNATAAAVQTALTGLSTIGIGNATVSKLGSVYQVTFATSALGGNLITANSMLLAVNDPNFSDTFTVALSQAPMGGETVTVNLNVVSPSGNPVQFEDGSGNAITQLTFTGAAAQTVRVVSLQDGVVEGPYKQTVTLTTKSSLAGSGYNGDPATNHAILKNFTVNVGDADSPQVVVNESNLSTNVIEGGGVGAGAIPISSNPPAYTPPFSGAPYTDDYTIVLSKAPSQDVYVDLSADPTRTSRQGGFGSDVIDSFQPQLSFGGANVVTDPTTGLPAVHFTPTNWYIAQQVLVQAIDNQIVDGGDTKVFAQQLDLVSNIQGPLFINGAPGPDHSELTSREPQLLPGETNSSRALQAPIVSAADITDLNGITTGTITISAKDALSILNEVQTLTVDASGGYFTLSFNGSLSTGHLNAGATASQVQSALEGLSTIGSGNVAVTQAGNQYTITFQGSLGHSNQPQIVADGSNLTLTPATAAVGTTVNGNSTTDEVQQVIVDATSGTFTLSFDGQTTTPPIAYNASAGTVQAALEALSTIGAGNVGVTSAPAGTNATVYTITFQAGLHHKDVDQITVDASGLTGPGSAVVLTQIDGIAATPANLASQLINLSVQVTDGVGKNKVRFITGVLNQVPNPADPTDTLITLALNKPWEIVSTDPDQNVAALFTNIDIPTQAAVSATLAQAGGGGKSEIQIVTVDASGVLSPNGTYVLSLGGVGATTAPIAFNASADDVKAALSALPGLAGKVSVLETEKSPINKTSRADVYIYTVMFDPSLGNTEPLLAAPVPEVTTYQQGDATHQEIQVLTVQEGTGSYQLSLGAGGPTTAPIATAATAATLKADLEALPGIGTGNVSAAMTAKGLPGAVQDVYTITFLTFGDKPQLVSNVSTLTDVLINPVFGGGKFTLTTTNPNLLVDENTQTDNLYVYDGDNPSNASGVMTASAITGLGMPATQVIGGVTQPGGISYSNLEEIYLNLGSGDNNFTIQGTGAGTAVTLNAGNGKDNVNVLSLGGHTYINGQAGNDTVNVSNPASAIVAQSGRTIQEVFVDATGGTFSLSFNNGQTTQTTGPLAYNISASAMQTALNSLTTIGGAGGVSVAQFGNDYRVTFLGLLGTTQQNLLTANSAGLTVTPASVTPAITTPGDGTHNEVQTVVVNGANGGAYTLTFNGQTTAPIAYNATAVGDINSVQTILSKLSNIGIGNVAVTGGAGGPYTITFQGTLANQALPLLTADASGLMGVGLPVHTLQSLQGLLTVSGDVPQANVVTLAHGSPAGVVISAVSGTTQQIDVDATGGQFALSFGGQKTTNLNLGATATQLQNALNALSSIGPNGGVSVTKLPGNHYLVTFQGALANFIQPLFTADISALTGIVVSAVNTIQQLTVDATGGTYALSFNGQTTGPINYNAPGSAVAALTTTQQGNGTQPQIETLALTADSGTFTLTFNGHKTGPLAYNITAAALQAAIDTLTGLSATTVSFSGGLYTINFATSVGAVASSADAGGLSLSGSVRTALEGLSSIGTGNVQVVKAGNIYRITFIGALAGADQPLLQTHDGLLTNGFNAVDQLNIDDSAYALPEVGVLTPTTLTGLSNVQANEIQELHLDATSGSFKLTFNGATTASQLAWNISAADMQAALQALSSIGTGNVAVTKNDDVYVIRFQGLLTNTNVPQITVNSTSLQRVSEAADGSLVTTNDALNGSGQSTLVQINTRTNGQAAIPINDVQTVTVNATGGFFALSLAGHGVETAPLRYDASAEEVRAALQFALEGNTNKTDLEVSKYRNVYIIAFQGQLRDVNNGNPIPLLTVDTTPPAPQGKSTPQPLQGTISVATRMDGFNYYGFETVNLNLGSTPTGDVLNVQGTANNWGGTAPLTTQPLVLSTEPSITNVAFGAGDNKVFISSNADLDNFTNTGFDFLTGDLNQLYGSININFNSGRHRLMVSDEAAQIGDTNIQITDHASGTPALAQGLDSSAEIFITGLAQGGISYKGPGGNYFDGVQYWTGYGDDTVYIDGTENLQSSLGRTTTMLNTGLGNDHVIVNLQAGAALTVAQQGFANIAPQSDTLALNASGGTFTITVNGQTTGALAYNITAAALQTAIANLLGIGTGKVAVTANGAGYTITFDKSLGSVTSSADGSKLTGTDGFFVLNTMGGATTPAPGATENTWAGLPVGMTDNDFVDASASTLPLIMFGGFGDDTLIGGQGTNTIFGDFGRVQTVDATGKLVATYGYGGRGDLISSQNIPAKYIYSAMLGSGKGVAGSADDIVIGGTSDDILIGGPGNNMIDGGQGDDFIFGHNVTLKNNFNFNGLGVPVFNIANPRFEALTGTAIYSDTTFTDTVNVDGIGRAFRSPSGTYIPVWASWNITFLDQYLNPSNSNDPLNTPASHSGNNYIAGGGGDDMIFGGLGNDVILGDGSIASALTGGGAKPIFGSGGPTQVQVGTVGGQPVYVTAQAGSHPVYAFRADPVQIQVAPSSTTFPTGQFVSALGALMINPTFEASSDGNDYIEGGGGNNVVFGGLGQDDIIGGNSDLFSLGLAAQRPTGSSLIFGGSGQEIARNEGTVETLAVTATAGTFTLTLDTQTTAAIAYNAAASVVQAALGGPSAAATSPSARPSTAAPRSTRSPSRATWPTAMSIR